MNNMNIKVFDNFLEDLDRDYIQSYLDENKWILQISDQHKSIGLDFLMMIIPKDNFFHKHLFSKIEKILNKSFSIERIYFNGQFAGRHGSFHRDQCDRTVLIYLNDYYDPEWGGFTQLIGDKYPQTETIIPLPNRMVVFDGNNLHKGYAYSYQNCPMRISLAYKLNFL